MIFEVEDGTFNRPLVRFNGGNSGGFCSEEISKSGRFVSRGVAGGDDENVEGGEEGNCFFRQRELYVRWTLEDINFDAREVGAQCGGPGILRRRDASLWLCLHVFFLTCHRPPKLAAEYGKFYLKIFDDNILVNFTDVHVDPGRRLGAYKHTNFKLRQYTLASLGST